MTGLRMSKELTAAIDRWAKVNAIESRSEAIRRLIERGIASNEPEKP
jgi:metal-responsive CopG/Arc/MetJ family transcriptional regulator